MISEEYVKKLLRKKGYTEEEVEEILKGLEEGKRKIHSVIDESKKTGLITEKEAEEDKIYMEKMFVSNVVESLLSVKNPRKGFKGFQEYMRDFDSLAREVWEEDLRDRLMNPIKIRGDVQEEFAYKMRRKQRFWIEGSPFFQRPPEKREYVPREEVMPKPWMGGAFKGNIGGILERILKKKKRK